MILILRILLIFILFNGGNKMGGINKFALPTRISSDTFYAEDVDKIRGFLSRYGVSGRKTRQFARLAEGGPECKIRFIAKEKNSPRWPLRVKFLQNGQIEVFANDLNFDSDKLDFLRWRNTLNGDKHFDTKTLDKIISIVQRLMFLSEIWGWHLEISARFKLY